jgi:hypothetical protein
MQVREWYRLVEDINADIAGMIRAQQTLSEVDEALVQRAGSPIEEDFIHADMWGIDSAMPRITQVDGVSIQTRMLHRRGLSQRDIKGADLLYEIVGRKFALVQYKKPDRQGRVKRDTEQLDELIVSCPTPCPPFQTGFAHRCGSWYAVRPDTPNAASYVPACVAAQVFGESNSRKEKQFRFGLSFSDFQRAFGNCLTGGRLTPEELDRETLELNLIERDWVVFEALQFGSFGERTP